MSEERWPKSEGRKEEGRVAQWRERLTHIQEVAGSIPAAPTILDVGGQKSEVR
jgi:hypothetical protein